MRYSPSANLPRIKLRKSEAGLELHEVILGRIFAKTVEDPETGCINWNGATLNSGYGVFVWWEDGRSRGSTVTRVVYRCTHGDISPDHHVCHRCDNPRCVNPEHLFAGTPAENAQDMLLKFRHAKGGSRYTFRHKTEEVVHAYNAGYSQIEIADHFGVSRSRVKRMLEDSGVEMRSRGRPDGSLSPGYGRRPMAEFLLESGFVEESPSTAVDLTDLVIDHPGHKLRQARLSKRMTQKDLARSLGVSGSALSRLEHGYADAKDSLLTLAYSVLGVKAEKAAEAV